MILTFALKLDGIKMKQRAKQVISFESYHPSAHTHTDPTDCSIWTTKAASNSNYNTMQTLHDVQYNIQIYTESQKSKSLSNADRFSKSVQNLS